MKTIKAIYRFCYQLQKLIAIITRSVSHIAIPYLIIMFLFLLGSYVIADIAIKTREVVLW